MRLAAAMVETGTEDPLRRRPEVFAVLALTCLYFAVIGGHSYSIDGLLIYRQALAIAQNFSLQFANPIYWGHLWTTSISGIGLALFYLPGVAVLTKIGVAAPVPTAAPGDWDLFYRDPVYAIGAAPVQILVTVATAYFVARFVRALGFGSKTALLALISFGVASPAIAYAREDFPQPLLGLCMITGLLAAQRFRDSGRSALLLAAGAMLILAVLTRPVEGSFLLPALLVMTLPNLRPDRWHSGPYRGVAIIIGSYAIAFALTLLVNWLRFGSPFVTGYTNVRWGTPFWVGVPGVLFSPARGILWQFPLLVLAPLGLWRLWRTPFRLVATVMSALTVVMFFHTALFVPWWGGFDWGARLFVPAWPLVAVLAAVGAMSLRSPRRLWLTAFLFVAGVIWAIPGTVTDLIGGYAGMYDGTAQSFLLTGYPPVGAWQFLHHIRASDLTDSNALDILWFRIARQTHNASMIVPVILALSAAAFAWKAVRMEQAAKSSGGGDPGGDFPKMFRGVDALEP
jgi:hypothetical protein